MMSEVKWNSYLCETPESTITMLKECIDSINAGVFEGIVIVSKGVETGCWVNKGNKTRTQ